MFGGALAYINCQILLPRVNHNPSLNKEVSPMHFRQVSLHKIFLCGLFCCASLMAGAQDTEFQQVTSFPTGNSPRSVALADFNQDGKLDIVTANQNSNNVSVLLGNGNGTFRTAINTALANRRIHLRWEISTRTASLTSR